MTKTSTRVSLQSTHQIPEASKEERIRIDAKLLIPGRGKPIKHGTLVCGTHASSCQDEKGKILYVGSTEDLPSQYSNSSALTVPVVMPGMWDCHVHFFGEAEPDFEKLPLIPPALAGIRSARDIVATLNAGFTSVREVGGYGIDISSAVDDGWIPGPHIYSAGALISQTAGHGDLHTQPIELIHQKTTAGLPLHLADGVDEAIKAVRLQIRRGAKLIKLCATGGVLSRNDSPRASQFTSAELEAMVAEATRTDLYVAAHAHGTNGIIAALKAGVKTIEHGSYLNAEAIDLMKEKDAMLVATRYISVVGLEHPEFMSKESYKKLLETANAREKSYADAVKAGVKCALGTDLGISSTTVPFNHGMNGHEFKFAVEAGMTPLQAIEAGTANGPDTLGPQAPKSGKLEEGYDADFIALSDDPIEDIKILAQADKITHVWKGGRCFKSPDNPIALY